MAVQPLSLLVSIEGSFPPGQGTMCMPNHSRLPSVAALLVLLAACSRTEPASSALSDELKADLARVGSGVELAGAAAPRLEVVSDMERTEPMVSAPKAPAVTRASSANRRTRVAVRNTRRAAPVPARPAVTEDGARVETPRDEPTSEPVLSQQRPQRAPLPSTQREPAGGWRTPGEIIRNAPFPIKPARSEQQGR